MRFRFSLRWWTQDISACKAQCMSHKRIGNYNLRRHSAIRPASNHNISYETVVYIRNKWFCCANDSVEICPLSKYANSRRCLHSYWFQWQTMRWYQRWQIDGAAQCQFDVSRADELMCWCSRENKKMLAMHRAKCEISINTIYSSKTINH